MSPEALPPPETFSAAVEVLLGLRNDVQLLTTVGVAICAILLAACLCFALLGWVHHGR